MRLSTLLVLGLSLGLASVGFANASEAQDEATPTSLNPAAEPMSIQLDVLNEMRQKRGLATLVRHDGLDAIATAYANELAERQILDHHSPTTGSPADRVDGASIHYARVGENLSHHRNLDGAWKALWGSAPHKKQMLDGKMTHIGVASVEGRDGVYLVQVFIAQPTHELPPPLVQASPKPANAESTDVKNKKKSSPPVLTGDAVKPARPNTGSLAENTVPAPPASTLPNTPSATPEAPQTPAQPTLTLKEVNRAHRGYWKHEAGRWWYFPVPQNAYAGMVLAADPNRQGPPPNYRR